VDFSFPMTAGLYDEQIAWRPYPYPTDYVYSGLYEVEFDEFDQENNYIMGFDPLGPFENNYLWRNFVPGLTNLNSGGDINTGASSGHDWNWNYVFYLNNPVYQFQPPSSDWTTFPSVLGTNDTQWLYSYPGGSLSEIGITYSSGPNFTMVSNARNIYGLPFLSAEIAYYDESSGDVATTTLSAGGSTTQSGYFYPETAQPQFQTVEYDFWQPDSDQLPGYAFFSPTNTSRLWITPVASSIRIAGYAKLAITNGYSGVYAYLGQYFDQAYKKDDNGNVTTNTTGVLSPYGNFFATEPGPAALVTMPDVDTGARGTCTVSVASIQVDKNSDGNMNLSFSGPDATSQASPMWFWVNSGYSGVTGNAKVMGGILPNYSYGNITCSRDLENFARLWICGLPSLPANQNYTVTLSWQNIYGNPGINLYNSVETNGGIGYLTETNIAAQQSAFTNIAGSGYGYYRVGPGVAIAEITNGTTFTFPASYFTNGSNKYFLFEGAGIGEGELTLTISQNGNTIAQTGVWLDLHDIKDFYERAVIANNMGVAISNWSSTIQTVQNATASISDTDSNLIVFVHGINVDNWHWLDDSDTVFKRLYWSGYHGRFATVDWPCNMINYVTFLTLDVDDFNDSEIKAYKAGIALKTYLSQLRTRFPGGRLNLFVHSQGNAVVSEAIEQGAPFDTYILTQGALPASCYDVNAPTNSTLVGRESFFRTPEWQPMGYHGVYTNLPGNIVNFFNSQDKVLGYWYDAQKLFKPTISYSYNGTNSIYTGIISSYTVTDPQESRSEVSRSRTLSIGAQGLASGETKQGVISSTVDLHAQFGFNGDTTDEHSAQWTRPVQTSLLYYYSVMSACGIPTSPLQ
jgi:hypothetical protein